MVSGSSAQAILAQMVNNLKNVFSVSVIFHLETGEILIILYKSAEHFEGVSTVTCIFGNIYKPNVFLLYYYRCWSGHSFQMKQLQLELKSTV